MNTMHETCSTCEHWNRDEDNIIFFLYTCTHQESEQYGEETEHDFRCEHWE